MVWIEIIQLSIYSRNHIIQSREISHVWHGGRPFGNHTSWCRASKSKWRELKSEDRDNVVPAAFLVAQIIYPRQSHRTLGGDCDFDSVALYVVLLELSLHLSHRLLLFSSKGLDRWLLMRYWSNSSHFLAETKTYIADHYTLETFLLLHQTATLDPYFPYARAQSCLSKSSLLSSSVVSKVYWVSLSHVVELPPKSLNLTACGFCGELLGDDWVLDSCEAWEWWDFRSAVVDCACDFLRCVPVCIVDLIVVKKIGNFLKRGRSAGRLPQMIARLSSTDDHSTTSTLSPRAAVSINLIRRWPGELTSRVKWISEWDQVF